MSREQLLQTLWGENRKRVLIMLFVLLLIGGIQLWQGFWVGPRLKNSSVELRQLRSDLRLEKQRVAAGGGAVIDGLTEDVDHFYKMVPLRSGLGSFIGRLYSYAEKAGIDIAQISYQPKQLKEMPLLEYQLSFSVDGDYKQVKKFIHLLENSPSILILNSISLGSSQREKKRIVGLQIQLQTFFREEGP